MNDENRTKRMKHQTSAEEPLVEETDQDENDGASGSMLTYQLQSSPPFPVTLFTSLQHIIICLPSCLYTASMVADVACAPYNHPVRATLFCATMFMAGLCTIFQTGLGVRLPVFQGPSATFIVPLLAMTDDPAWRCDHHSMMSSDGSMNATNTSVADSSDDLSSIIHTRLQMMSGALMLASLFEIAMGSIGLLGFLLRYIGPITVATTISLIGVSLVSIPIIYARPSFPVAIACMVLILIFILYCQNVKIPINSCPSKSQKKPQERKYLAIFQLFPILVGLVIMWVVVWVMTLAGAFTDDKTSEYYYARADAKINVVSMSPWFQLSYPGMFGAPKISIALATGFTISCLSSMVESVGDYYAAQKACEVTAPPNHAISRGILVEGIGTLISGAVGVGHATTSYSGNISVLTLSKTASRAVLYTAGTVLILLSCFGKLGAAFTTIPNPVLGGICILINGTLVSIGLANLKHVDMTTSRNLLVFGLPFILGIGVPKTLEMYPGLIDTGIQQLDGVIHAVIGSPMFLGGALALLLDNTVPGTYASRGMVDPHQINPLLEEKDNHHVYSWPLYPKVAKLFPFLTSLPFMPDKPLASREDLQNVTVDQQEIQ